MADNHKKLFLARVLILKFLYIYIYFLKRLNDGWKSNELDNCIIGFIDFSLTFLCSFLNSF